MALQEVAVACARQEAQVLRVALARHRQAGLPRELTHLRLAHAAEREAQARQRRGRERREDVALVLADVDGHPQQPAVLHARVVTGRERLRPQPLAQLEHRVESHVAVAAHARVGRETRAVIGQPALDHAGAELRSEVDRQVRHAQAVRQLARAAHGLRRAAAGLAVVLGVGPQLERHPDRLLAALGDQQRGDGAVDAAAHRHERARGHGRQAGLLARRPAEGAVQRIGRQLRGVALGGAQPAELPGDLLGPDPGCAQQRRAAQQGDRRAAGRDRRAAAARVEAGVGDGPLRATRIDGQRDADQIAAGRAAGGARTGVGRDMPATQGVLEMIGEALGGGSHPAECRARSAALR